MSANRLLRKGALGAVLAITVMIMSMLPAQMFAATTSSRLAGSDRISTATAIADAFGAADTVILAAADNANLVDSLAVAPLAGKVSPIYLTGKNSLDSAVKAKLKGKNVYVIGAVSNAVFAQVQTIANFATKLSGANRLATNEAINARLTNVAGTFVVGFNAIPDALSVASYAAANNYAIVLANPDGSVDSGKLLGAKTYMVGGSALVKNIPGATRLSGADRFATNAAVINQLNFSFDTVYLANGLSLVDALAGSPLAAKTAAPIIITNNITVNETFNSKLPDEGKIVALGGTGAISNAILSRVAAKSPQSPLGPQITEYVLTNNAGTEFDQTSTTLVVDETAYLSSITVMTDGDKEEVTNTDEFNIKSSNPGVISVDNDTTTLTAQSPGTARITISYGNVTKQVTLTVVNEERVLTKVRFKDFYTDKIITSLKTIIPDIIVKESVIRIEPIDQYGDKIPDENLECSSTNDTIMSLDSSTVPSDGRVEVTGINTGTAFISVYDDNDIKKGSLMVTVSDNSEVASAILGIYKPLFDSDCDDLVSGTKKADFSTDATIDISADKYVAYRLSQYNDEGIYLGADTTVTTSIRESSTDVVSLTDNGEGVFIIEGLKEGTATLVLTDDESSRIYTAKITVIKEGANIQSVSFKSLTKPSYPKTFNYKSVFNYTETGNDPIIKGITLYKATSFNIRLQTSDGCLYLDKDGDGLYSSDDTELGYFEISTSGDISDYAGANVEDGVRVTNGDSGTVFFKVKSPEGKVIKTTYVTVDL
jgi:putative cell wall-binding protein